MALSSDSQASLRSYSRTVNAQSMPHHQNLTHITRLITGGLLYCSCSFVIYSKAPNDRSVGVPTTWWKWLSWSIVVCNTCILKVRPCTFSTGHKISICASNPGSPYREHSKPPCFQEKVRAWTASPHPRSSLLRSKPSRPVKIILMSRNTAVS